MSNDDRWRDTYDEWKLRSPYDDYADEEPCLHEEYGVSWEGRASCDYCSHHWWLNTAEMAAYERLEREYEAEHQRHLRRERSWFWRTVRWLARWVPKRRAKFNPPMIDNDIPF